MLDYWKYHVCIYENSEEYQKQLDEVNKQLEIENEQNSERGR